MIHVRRRSVNTFAFDGVQRQRRGDISAQLSAIDRMICKEAAGASVAPQLTVYLGHKISSFLKKKVGDVMCLICVNSI